MFRFDPILPPNAGYEVEPRSRYEVEERICAIGPVRQIANGQILIEETFFDSRWGFLVARKDEQWVLVRRERLQILCW